MRLNRSIHYGLVLVCLLVVLCAFALPAYAYADPGAGLFLVQVVGSTFVGFTLLIRNKVKRVLARVFGSGKASPTDVAP